MINGFKTKAIIHKNLGEKLKQTRARKKLTIEDAEIQTQVRLRYLQAFEENNFACLPDEVYAVGYLKRYLNYLGLDQEKYTNEFEHNYAAWKSIHKLKLKPKIQAGGPRFVITPKLILALSGVVAVLVVTSYIWFQIHHLTAPPQLQVNNPHSSDEVALQNIEITGNTDPEATVSINNQAVDQDQNGHFKQSVALEKGLNTIKVVATNRFQKQNTQILTVVKTTKGVRNVSQKNS